MYIYIYNFTNVVYVGSGLNDVYSLGPIISTLYVSSSSSAYYFAWSSDYPHTGWMGTNCISLSRTYRPRTHTLSSIWSSFRRICAQKKTRFYHRRREAHHVWFESFASIYVMWPRDEVRRVSCATQPGCLSVLLYADKRAGGVCVLDAGRERNATQGSCECVVFYATHIKLLGLASRNEEMFAHFACVSYVLLLRYSPSRVEKARVRCGNRRMVRGLLFFVQHQWTVNLVESELQWVKK